VSRVNKKADPRRKRLARLYLANLRVVPFAGITQIRFQGYNLRLVKPPQLDMLKYLNLRPIHVKHKFFLNHPTIGTQFDNGSNNLKRSCAVGAKRSTRLPLCQQLI
jgi:hypothetical protein